MRLLNIENESYKYIVYGAIELLFGLVELNLIYIFEVYINYFSLVYISKICLKKFNFMVYHRSNINIKIFGIVDIKNKVYKNIYKLTVKWWICYIKGIMKYYYLKSNNYSLEGIKERKYYNVIMNKNNEVRLEYILYMKIVKTLS